MTFRKIKFVTDSTSDIPPELVAKWHITVIPAFVNYGGNSYADDGVEIKRDEFFRMLPTMSELPTTAAPSSGLAEKMILEAFQDADHLILLTAPAKLSGIYNAFRLGCTKLPSDRYTLIDSGTVSAALGWQVIIGAQVAAETGDIQSVVDAISRVRANQRLYAAFATVEYLRRSGRVNRALAGLSELLQIKPILDVRDSEALAAYRIRTFSRALEKLAELTLELAPLDKMTILHANNMEDAQRLKASLGDALPSDTNILLVNTAVGTHVGPGTVGVAPVSHKWRN
jgi:DegV family protein with EDD domain